MRKLSQTLRLLSERLEPIEDATEALEAMVSTKLDSLAPGIRGVLGEREPGIKPKSPNGEKETVPTEKKSSWHNFNRLLGGNGEDK